MKKRKNHTFFSSPYNGSTVIKNKTRKRKQIIMEWMANESLCHAIRFESFTTSCPISIRYFVYGNFICIFSSALNIHCKLNVTNEKKNEMFFFRPCTLYFVVAHHWDQNVRSVHEFGSAWNEIGVDWDIHFKQVLFIFAFFGILFVSTIWFLFFYLLFQ